MQGHPGQEVAQHPLQGKAHHGGDQSPRGQQGGDVDIQNRFHDHQRCRPPQHDPHDPGKQFGDRKGAAAEDERLAGNALDHVDGQDNGPKEPPGSQVMRDLEEAFLHPGIEVKKAQEQFREKQHPRRAGDMADKVPAKLQGAAFRMVMAGYGAPEGPGQNLGDNENRKKGEPLDHQRREAAHDGCVQRRRQGPASPGRLHGIGLQIHTKPLSLLSLLRQVPHPVPTRLRVLQQFPATLRIDSGDRVISQVREDCQRVRPVTFITPGESPVKRFEPLGRPAMARQERLEDAHRGLAPHHSKSAELPARQCAVGLKPGRFRHHGIRSERLVGSFQARGEVGGIPQDGIIEPLA